MLDDASPLPDDPRDLKELVARLAEELKHRELRIAKLEHELAGHRRHRFGSTSESLDQLQLGLEDAEIAAAKAAKPAPAIQDEQKAKPKRKPLPADLPRNETVLSPGEACGRCGGTLKLLGEDVTEELEYVPGQYIVNRIVRPRMACSCCETICQAPLPSRPIERGRPGPGLLAHVLVGKYADHLPLYRQSLIFDRNGIDLDRSTLADWVGKSAALLEPLADAIGRHVRAGQALFADDTPIKMQVPGNGSCKTARIWTYVRDERPWLGQAPPAAWYQFTVDRKGTHPAGHLAGYNGWMHAPSRQIALQSPAGQWMATAASTSCIDPAASLRSRAWPISGASSSMSSSPRARSSPRKRSDASQGSMPSRSRPAASHPTSASVSDKPMPGRSSTSWTPGCRRS